MASPPFHVRDAGLVPNDADFIMEAFDAAISHLPTIGSGDQWGSQPFSEKPDFVRKLHDRVDAAVEYRLTGQGEPNFVFICEVDVDATAGVDEATARSVPSRTDVDGKRFMPVGAVVVKDRYFPAYVDSEQQNHLAGLVSEAKDDGDFMYLEILITDFRAGPLRKGAGAALVARTKELLRSRGRKNLWVDCWAGNSGRLTAFYSQQGFVKVGDFCVERHGKPSWPGTLLHMTLPL